MAGPSRTRRTLKWIATCLSLAILVLFLGDLDIQRQVPKPVPLKRIAGYAIPFALALASAIYLWLKDRPYARGYCHQCGYNLRGNLSGRCPECGSVVLPVQDQQDLGGTSTTQCSKCGCDLSGRFTGTCPECGAQTPKFPPGHCQSCGYSFESTGARSFVR